MFEWEQWFKIEQEITKPARAKAEGAKKINIYISRQITATVIIHMQYQTRDQHCSHIIQSSSWNNK